MRVLNRVHKPSGIPRDEYFAKAGCALLSSLVARGNLPNPEAALELLGRICQQHLRAKEAFTGLLPWEQLLLSARVKGRKWGTMQNVPRLPTEADVAELRREAEAYRAASGR